MKLRKLFAIVFSLVLVFTLVACSGKTITVKFETNGGSAVADVTISSKEVANLQLPANPTKADHVFGGWYIDAELTKAFSALDAKELNVTLYAKWSVDWEENDYVDQADYKAYVKYDLGLAYNSIKDYLLDSQKTPVKDAYEAGLVAIDEAASVAKVQAAKKAAVEAMANCVPLADGIYSYVGLNNAQKTEILGILENYAVSTGSSGISLFENGSYVMYNERITLGTENYITGYGFGTLAEGAITAPLATETNEAWKMYYHTYDSSDPGSANYYNDQGSQIGDYFDTFAGAFYTTYMNETKDGYDWTCLLAKEKPVAVNPNEDGTSATWKFEVRVGDEAKYHTNSTLRAKYDGRGVALEDYETAFKLLLTKKNGLYRGSELASTKNGAIVGAKDFYNGTADGFNADLWANVGIKTFVEEGKSYFQVTYEQPTTQFYAMYYIASVLYQPLPQEFIDEVTVENLCGFNKDMTQTPVDNSLSLGAYTLEAWKNNDYIVFAKNPYYVDAATKYSVQGIHYVIYTAAQEDSTYAIKQFLAGNIDAAGIPQDYLDQYKSDPRTRQTKGSSNFKLNVNATNEETWVALFGKNGKVCQTEEEDYWVLCAALSNRHFVQGLSYSIDRLTFGSNRGSVPSVNYFSSNYMSDNENGISYNSTKEHAKAVEQLLTDTDGYGYSLELARDYFRMALAELEAAGTYKPGTVENPTEINIQIAWMYTTHEKLYHNEIKQYLENAFNDVSVSGGKYKLNVNFWVGQVWSDVYYNKMMVGQFDLGFGSISGNSLDPLGFMNVLSSDTTISGSFTLNWGCDTNDPTSFTIVYNGLRWSYDALYMAATSSAIVSQGVNKPIYEFDYSGLEKQEDGSYVATATWTYSLPDITEVELLDIALCDYANYYGGSEEYSEDCLSDDPALFSAVSEAIEGGYKVTVTVPASYVAAYNAAFQGEADSDYLGYMGFDFYFVLTFNGNTSGADGSVYESVDDYF